MRAHLHHPVAMPARALVPDGFGYRPFTLADAKAAGVSEGVLRGSRFRRVFRGVYVRAETLDSPCLRLDAARLVGGIDAWATCHTAAALYDLPVPDHPHTHIGLAPGWPRPRCAGLSAHQYRAQPRTATARGRRVATPEDTSLQLAAYLDLVDLVVVGDRLVRLGYTVPARLVEATAAFDGRGARLARRAAGLVRPRVDSPMETRLRLLIVLGGLPEPETGRHAFDSAGGWIATPDLSYHSLRIAIEYDGADHTKPRQRHKDNRRRESYDHEGWRLLVVTGTDMFQFPAQTLVRVWTALIDRRHPRVPRQLSEAWRQHFAIAPAPRR